MERAELTGGLAHITGEVSEVLSILRDVFHCATLKNPLLPAGVQADQVAVKTCSLIANEILG